MGPGLGVVVALTLLLTASSAFGNYYPTEVVELTDANFEHDTQASTGQTTGVWAVLFTDSTLKRHERAVQVVAELAQDDEKELIYAQVDVARNIRLARRFGDVIFPPCILLFRSQQMYVFDQSFDREDIAQQIRDFVASGYALASPLDVPEPRDRQINLEELRAGTQMDFKTVGFAVLLIVGGLLFQTWAVVNKDKFRSEAGTSATKKASEKAAPAAAAAATKPAASPGGSKGGASKKTKAS